MKVMYVGDPHVRPDNLEESQKLVDFIARTCMDNGVQSLVLLGDQFHTHSVIHMSVLRFWNEAFRNFKSVVKNVYALVGNHDMSGKIGDTDHAMMLYDPCCVTVVDKPTLMPWGALAIPYYADPKEFVEAATSQYSEGLICHQTFDGSMYENGFYAKDGIVPETLPHKWIISGHIHTPQKLGKVWYPGSPRWQSISDANVNRAIWIIEYAESVVKGMTSFDTSGVCRPIYAFVDNETEPLKYDFNQDADVLIDVYGSPEYVKNRTKFFEDKGARVRPFPNTNKVMKVKESDGLPLSFRKFVGTHESKHGTPKDRLLNIAEQRISWMKT